VKKYTDICAKAITLPAQCANPVGKVADSIQRVQEALRDEFGSKAEYSQRLLDAQLDLCTKLGGTIPLYAPVASAHAAVHTTLREQEQGLFGDANVGRVVWADDVVRAVQK
jgi:hypothetical protein